MACNLEAAEGVKTPADCKCYGAVLRTYKEMRQTHAPENYAKEAALRVYLYHHPEDRIDQAKLTIESWIYTQAAH